MKTAATVVVCLVFVLLLASSAAAAEPESASGGKLTFYHAWTSPSEAAALNALTALFTRKYPGVAVAPSVVRVHEVRSVGLFQTVSNNVRARRPPDAFQMDAGYSVEPFFDAGLLAPIDDLWTAEGFDKAVSPFILEMSKQDGHFYSVPIGIHRTNVVWINKKVLDKHQIKAATLTTWDAFFRAAETLRAAGVREPIQMGEAWTASHVFQCIMASVGMGAYQDWINGKITSADDPRLRSALKIFAKYLSYANADNATLEWDKATDRVIKGEGAFCIMGDWANGEFKHAGMKYGEGYEAIPVPGTEGLYGMNVDAFLHPRGLRDETQSKRWLKLVASREGQDAFNAVKGSIPVRGDADASKYDAYQRSAIVEMKAAKAYPAVAQGAPTAFGDKLDHILTEFVKDRDTDKAAKAMAAMTATLKGKFTRVWSLQ
jgi:glucose/mannose transport system substrate-binding protein